MMEKKSILFGFYKGLGDFISDSYIMEVFIRNGFHVSVVVSHWFYDLARFMLPLADIIPYKSSKDIVDIDYDYGYIFLTPNYLHPASLEKRALWLYLSKLFIVKSKTDAKIIHPSLKDLFFHYFQLKKTFLDEHFYLMSLYLIRKYFPHMTFRPLAWNTSSKPKISRIVVFPFSGNEKKDYPIHNYIFLLRKLKEEGIKDIDILVTQKDIPKVKSLEKEFSVKSMSLVDLAKYFKKTDLIISGDTGPAHLAAYYSGNVVVLYGYTKPEKYKPLGEGKILTLKSETGKVGDISHKEIFKSIKENFVLRGREKDGEHNVIYLYSNV